jgi:uncharacterized membrane protein
MTSANGGRPGERAGKALAAASVALGVPQLAAPGAFARAIGLTDTAGTRALIRAVGARELAAAAGILAQRRPVAGLWGRVGGDLMDLALLGNALRSGSDQRRGGRFIIGRRRGGRSRSDRRRVGIAAAAVGGIAALDLFAAVRSSRRVHPSRRPVGKGAVHVEAAITVNLPVEDVYAFWRDLSRLPTFMAHLESVKPDGDGRSHWTASGPAGVTVEWDAVIVEDVAGELLAWRSAEIADIGNSGVVRFRTAPGGRGTEVHVELTYEPPAGRLGATVARLLGDEPQQQISDDLRRFKQVIETGEVVRSDGTPEGPDARRLLRQRPAQPLPG